MGWDGAWHHGDICIGSSDQRLVSLPEVHVYPSYIKSRKPRCYVTAQPWLHVYLLTANWAEAMLMEESSMVSLSTTAVLLSPSAVQPGLGACPAPSSAPPASAEAPERGAAQPRAKGQEVGP